MSITKNKSEVLLVDDCAEDLELAMTVLSDYWPAEKIVAVRDGVEALDFLLRRGEYSGRAAVNPALILLDIKMPKIDGIEVLRRIKADPKLRVIPIVILSSSREERDVVECYRLGSNAYVVKPLVFAEFYAALTKLAAFWLSVNEMPAGSL